jgi:hypothetical protein
VGEEAVGQRCLSNVQRNEPGSEKDVICTIQKVCKFHQALDNYIKSTLTHSLTHTHTHTNSHTHMHGRTHTYTHIYARTLSHTHTFALSPEQWDSSDVMLCLTAGEVTNLRT